MRWANIPLFFFFYFFFSPTIVVCLVFFWCIEAVHLLVFEFGREKNFVFSNFLVTLLETHVRIHSAIFSLAHGHIHQNVLALGDLVSVIHLHLQWIMTTFSCFFSFFVVFFGGRVCQTWRNVTSGWNCVVSFIVHIDFFVFVCTFNLN